MGQIRHGPTPSPIQSPRILLYFMHTFYHMLYILCRYTGISLWIQQWLETQSSLGPTAQAMKNGSNPDFFESNPSNHTIYISNIGKKQESRSTIFRWQVTGFKGHQAHKIQSRFCGLTMWKIEQSMVHLTLLSVPSESLKQTLQIEPHFLYQLSISWPL